MLGGGVLPEGARFLGLFGHPTGTLMATQEAEGRDTNFLVMSSLGPGGQATWRRVMSEGDAHVGKAWVLHPVHLAPDAGDARVRERSHNRGNAQAGSPSTRRLGRHTQPLRTPPYPLAHTRPAGRSSPAGGTSASCAWSRWATTP